ncbi:MAG TPA: putative glycolipid-binding domain-containing protein [Pyrinomonadaceae bacterium]|nr:putative glycolipid-binding domain-containing protein [Pyrinomonadaceae bacterium]
MSHSIIWRGIYFPGHEACRLDGHDNKWSLEGTAVFSNDQLPCRLSYLIVCDSRWNTLRGSVSGWVGDDDVNIEVTVDEFHQWQFNGRRESAVDGCVDLDLNFSPVTNLLPIRRLNLGIGEHAEVKAAWLRFPSFELEPLVQVYTRLDESRYRYSSSDGEFVRELTVNEVGFVIDYPGFWTAD